MAFNYTNPLNILIINKISSVYRLVLTTLNYTKTTLKRAESNICLHENLVTNCYTSSNRNTQNWLLSVTSLVTNCNQPRNNE